MTYVLLLISPKIRGDAYSYLKILVRNPKPSTTYLPLFMQAIFHTSFGDASQLQSGDLPTPIPKKGEVRIQVAAAALNPLDVEIREGKLSLLYGKSFPMIPGHDFAGTIVEVGPSVSAYKPGNQVYGMRPTGKGGAMADYLVVRASQIGIIPEGLGPLAAAALPLAAQTALQGLRDEGRLQPGQHVLINGASGGVGVFAVQIANILGAHVTAVCSHRNLDLVRSLGADTLIDYTQTRPESLDTTFDLVFDVYGNKWFSKIRHLLTPKGRHVSTIPALPNLIAQYRSLLGRKRTRVVIVRSHTADLNQLSTWIQTGQLKPIIDRTYESGQIQEAYRYLETRRAQGKVVIEWGVE